MATEESTSEEQRVIKRYSNRKLYDTKESRYVTLQQIGEMVRRGDDVQIIDNKTKEDKTEVTLALIISEDLKNTPRGVSVTTLRNLIQERGEKMLSTLRDGPLGRLIPGTEEGEEGVAEGTEPEPAAAAAVEAETTDADGDDGDKPKGRVKETLDQIQTMLDERVEAVVPGMRTIRELRQEVDALRSRVDELEKKLSDE